VAGLNKEESYQAVVLIYLDRTILLWVFGMDLAALDSVSRSKLQVGNTILSERTHQYGAALSLKIEDGKTCLVHMNNV
jgi:hypothetical protein